MSRRHVVRNQRKPERRAAKKQVAKPAKQSERTLHMHAQQWLEKSGWWRKLLIFHVPNERRGSIGTIMHFKRLGVRPGVADYLIFGAAATVDGFRRGVAVELKDDEGKQELGQIRFQAQWEASGNTYFIVRTLGEFQNVIEAFDLFG